MKKIWYYFIPMTFFAMVWCVLSETFSIWHVITGYILSFLTILFTNKFLLQKNYIITYHLPVSVILRYVLFLIYQIYKSGISSLIKIVRGHDHAYIYTYQTVLTNELCIGLLANAITSTPGTVTIDKQGQTIRILSLGALDHKSVESFEKILGGKR